MGIRKAQTYPFPVQACDSPNIPMEKVCAICAHTPWYIGLLVILLSRGRSSHRKVSKKVCVSCETRCKDTIFYYKNKVSWLEMIKNLKMEGKLLFLYKDVQWLRFF